MKSITRITVTIGETKIFRDFKQNEVAQQVKFLNETKAQYLKDPWFYLLKELRQVSFFVSWRESKEDKKKRESLEKRREDHLKKTNAIQPPPLKVNIEHIKVVGPIQQVLSNTQKTPKVKANDALKNLLSELREVLSIDTLIDDIDQERSLVLLTKIDSEVTL